jgi:hypothetical protein
MTKYNIHLYREMRLEYVGIEADTPEAAALIARQRQTEDADNVEDCNGDELSALVDVAGDEDYSQSVMIDFEGERQRKAAPALLAALKVSEGFVHWALDHGANRESTSAALEHIRDAIAKAEAAGIALPGNTGDLPVRFEIEHDPQENPDRAYVMVDGTFDVAIIRTAEGIVIDVYPKDWIDPIDSMTVWDADVAEASAEAETDQSAEA